ncbi:2Fe-2S iron-sulfur cluster-binding protein [Phyllobacterium sp. A18/5-2]|uniref:2Fe-2S iron-sulfur cluster-binding protein n=1 Tax=Phyllobacterium sp. A18/5-2 TaxID=2978392 RepID=UPI0021C8B87F|nr:2Fe-2S iron-sulfur cluster-binding protein [Phyllobacterium sp. A18/5-2]UXN63376.1 2Fe-2S iron-sulfur cluster-binding protein [Phyllobacterium sp. A18/5-2]
MSQTIRFFLNGQKQEASVRPDMTVLDWLRSTPRLTGTKEGCAEGDCGACSVLIGDPWFAPRQTQGEETHHEGEVHYHAANSCILAMGQIDGRALVTVEGLKGEQLHPVQEAMAENGSSQCGFCTPGIVISLAGLAAGKAGANDDDIHDALAGNLCRCTGYRPIVEAGRKVISRRRREDRRAAGGRLRKDRTARNDLGFRRDIPPAGFAQCSPAAAQGEAGGDPARRRHGSRRCAGGLSFRLGRGGLACPCE